VGANLKLRRRLIARDWARAAFRATYPDREMRIHRVAVFDDFSVVTICTDYLRKMPATRAWWRVPSVEPDTCRELSYDEASQVIDIRPWL
jgi:hypothetical protein